MTDDQKHILIEKSLFDELSENERIAFNQWKNDAKNADEEIDAVKITLAFTESIPLLNFEKVAREHQEELIKRDKNTKRKKGFLLLGLIVISGCLSSIILTYNNDQEPLKILPQQKPQPSSIQKPESKTLPPTNTSSSSTAKPHRIKLDKKTPQSIHSSDSVHIEKVEEPISEVETETPPITPDSTETDYQITTKTKPQKIPCEALTGEISMFPTCQNDYTGSIEIHHINGGIAPFETTLLDNNNDETPLFDLPKGSYTLVIRDANKCQSSYTVEMKEKICETSFVFSPFVQKHWSIPTLHAYYTLRIFNSSGLPVFTKSYSSEEAVWNGLDEFNNPVPHGVYVFIIEYEDQTNFKGELSVIYE